MRMVRLYSQEDFDACPLDKWGIPDAGRERRDGKEEGLGRREDGKLDSRGDANGGLTKGLGDSGR